MASLLERGLLTELITCTTNLCDAHRHLPPERRLAAAACVLFVLATSTRSAAD